MAEEMGQHLEELTRANVANGMTLEEARFAAQRQFGGADQIEESSRDVRGILWIEQLLQDTRYAVRQLRKNSGLTLIVVLTLSLGIGATTAIFSVVNGVVLKPLPYPDAHQLVVINETFPPPSYPGNVSPGSFLDWQHQTASFSNIAAASGSVGNLTGTGDPSRVDFEYVTGNYFSTLGIHPTIGRDFVPEESSAGHENVAILGHRLWQAQFGGDPHITGNVLFLNGQAYTIVGVLPPNRPLNSNADLFIPKVFSASDKENFGGHPLRVIGRLNGGISLRQAMSEMDVVAGNIARQHPETNKGCGAMLTPLLETMVSSIRRLLFILFGAVAMLLLIACTNVANLLLARAITRQKEIAMRLALGASRGRIVRQFLCENLLVALFAGTCGVLLAFWSVYLIRATAQDNIPRIAELSIDARALGFTCGLTLTIGVLFGLVPAFHSTRGDVAETLKLGGRATGDNSHKWRLRGILVCAQIAMAFVLLVGAGLLGNSFVRLQKVDLGYDTRNVYLTRFELPQKQYSTPGQKVAFIDQLIDGLSNQSFIKSAAVTTSMPLFGGRGVAFEIAGRPKPDEDKLPVAYYSAITPDYFHTLSIPVIRGRGFTQRDATAATHVAIISGDIAKRFFPNEDPLGKLIRFSNQPEVWHEIVGVAGFVNQNGPASLDLDMMPGNVYEPYADNPRFGNVLFLVRVLDNSAVLQVAVRNAVHQIDKEIPVLSLTRLKDAVGATIYIQRLTLITFGFFSSVSLLLAAMGIYGVLAYNVTQRNGEIGIRMALGARKTDISRLILTSGGKVICLGLILGLIGAVCTSHLLNAWLFEIDSYDPQTFLGILVLLSFFGFLASWLPARRAANVDPMVALRSE